MVQTNIDQFTEKKKQTLDYNLQETLAKRINELPLKIQGTNLEKLIQELYQKLESHGISFRPKCYLSDDWGCPNGVPIIGVPFYLADPNLSRLEGELTGISAENDKEIMLYLSHEAGHAFNYAYKLYDQDEWQSIFGLFSQDYKEDYKPKPFSPSFVRHIPGWYAQKHPDEDFAETFAVWLTQGNWQELYNESPALTKLLYVNRVVQELGRKSPIVTKEILDMPVEELSDTLKDWYSFESSDYQINLPKIIDEDLKTLFYTTDSNKSAATFLREKRKHLSENINRWTGIDRELTEAVIDEIISRAKKLDLKIEEVYIENTLISLTIFITVMIMNYLHKDNFVEL